MSTDKIWQTKSTSSEQTEQLAEQLGQRLKGGEMIELIGDLGSGKTTFVRGLARGFGSPDRVASPTFTIARVYHAGQRTLHHFDFYRLSEPGLASAELAEVIDDPHVVTVVEWGGMMQDVLPKERMRIELQHAAGDTREITFHYPQSLNYLAGEQG